MNPTSARDVAAIAAIPIALLTLGKGVLEYVRQGAQKRTERFFATRLRFEENKSFKKICDLLESNDPRLRGIAPEEKRAFLGFYEDIALMLNSGLIRPAVAHYMFGYYALRCGESTNFWNNVDRECQYWALFNDFVERMKGVEAKMKRRVEAGHSFPRRSYRF